MLSPPSEPTGGKRHGSTAFRWSAVPCQTGTAVFQSLPRAIRDVRASACACAQALRLPLRPAEGGIEPGAWEVAENTIGGHVIRVPGWFVAYVLAPFWAFVALKLFSQGRIGAGVFVGACTATIIYVARRRGYYGGRK